MAGTHRILWQPLDLLARLAALVPPPRAHLATYHGMLALAAALLAAITEGRVVRAILEALGLPTEPPTVHAARGPSVEWLWA